MFIVANGKIAKIPVGKSFEGVPIVYLTQEEYDALTAEEKQSGEKVYLVETTD